MKEIFVSLEALLTCTQKMVLLEVPIQCSALYRSQI
uniref:Uncharacterized protein n=1 Tax=Arundo donax TaxID=35708 RepID=A0A0A9E2F4_ARUDO